jgi:hypothetical protein
MRYAIKTQGGYLKSVGPNTLAESDISQARLAFTRESAEKSLKAHKGKAEKNFRGEVVPLMVCPPSLVETAVLIIEASGEVLPDDVSGAVVETARELRELIDIHSSDNEFSITCAGCKEKLLMKDIAATVGKANFCHVCATSFASSVFQSTPPCEGRPILKNRDREVSLNFSAYVSHVIYFIDNREDVNDTSPWIHKSC